MLTLDGMSAGAHPGGCLTDAQLAQCSRRSPAGPRSLARPCASCERCQARALFGARRTVGGPRKAPPQPPSLGRALLLAGVVLAAIGAFFWTLLRS